MRGEGRGANAKNSQSGSITNHASIIATIVRIRMLVGDTIGNMMGSSRIRKPFMDRMGGDVHGSKLARGVATLISHIEPIVAINGIVPWLTADLTNRSTWIRSWRLTSLKGTTGGEAIATTTATTSSKLLRRGPLLRRGIGRSKWWFGREKGGDIGKIIMKGAEANLMANWRTR